MVGVAHEMTSDFNQMAEHRHQKCLRQKKKQNKTQSTQLNEYRRWKREQESGIETEQQHTTKLRDFIYRIIEKKKLSALTSYSSTDTIWHI